MLYHLVKKDLFLAKKYWIILLIVAVVLPAFIHTKLMAGGEFPSFFLSTLFIVYLLFNSFSMAEDKFWGSAYLCATPYTRKKLVNAKYMMFAALFLGCYHLYTLTALFGPIEMRLLNLYDIGLAFLILQLAFGNIIPVQYRCGCDPHFASSAGCSLCSVGCCNRPISLFYRFEFMLPMICKKVLGGGGVWHE